MCSVHVHLRLIPLHLVSPFRKPFPTMNTIHPILPFLRSVPLSVIENILVLYNNLSSL